MLNLMLTDRQTHTQSRLQSDFGQDYYENKDASLCVIISPLIQPFLYFISFP